MYNGTARTAVKVISGSELLMIMIYASEKLIINSGLTKILYKTSPETPIVVPIEYVTDRLIINTGDFRKLESLLVN